MKNKFFLTTFALLFLVSCVNQIDTDSEPVVDGNVPIIFTSNISPISTRVVDDDFEIGDKVGLYAIIAGSSLSEERYIDNLVLSYGKNKQMNPTHDVFYPTDGADLDFYAYYPYRSNAMASETTSLSVSVEEDQSTDADFSKSDFLIAKELAVENATSKVELDFNHKLSKCIIYLVFEDENAAEEALKSNPPVLLTDFYTKVSYDFSSDVFLQQSGIADMIPHGEWIADGNVLKGKELLVVPQEISDQRLILDIAGRVYTCALEEVSLSSGYQYMFKIGTGDLDEGVLNEIKATISPWEEGEEQDAEANDVVSEIYTGALSFNSSSIYRIYDGATPIAEICKEYLYKKDEIDSRAIVLYPIEDEVVNLENGLVLQLLDEAGDVHGGKVSWNKETNELTYTPGGVPSIQCFYFDENKDIVTALPNDPLEVRVNAYVLRDMRSGSLQKYPLVKIATQYWMREDLHATHYVDGTPMTEISTLDGTPGYAKNSDASHYFYTGEAVQTGLLAPDGWRIPSNVEWKKLKEYLDDNTDALKSGEWKKIAEEEYYPGNGKSGFEMLSSGLYLELQTGTKLYNAGSYTAYWMTEEQSDLIHNSNMVCQFSSHCNTFDSVNSLVKEKDYYHAFSVRCIKE